MNLSQKKKALVSATITASLVFPFAGSAELHHKKSLNQEITAFLDQEVQQFLEPWAEAKYDIAVRDGHKIRKECKNPDDFARVAASRPPVGAVRVNMTCADGSRSYRVVDVKVNIPVVVSRGSLARKQLLKSSDLKKIDIPWEKLRGQFYTDISSLIGRTLNRSVNTGKVVETNHLLPRYLIKKGESVTIQASKSGLKVSMMGTALESGELENRIQVRNRSSGRVLDALVTAKGKVEAVF